MNGAFLPYKFIGDTAYPMHPWFYSLLRERRWVSLEKRNTRILSN
jgi:hypothetical protein